MLRAKDPVIRSRFFFAETAWAIPRVISIFRNLVFILRPARIPSSVFPEAAVTGDTLAALFAGVLAARSTVRSPTAIPAAIPIPLIPNNGSAENSSPTPSRRMMHRIHVITIPSSTPSGIAILHQFSASSLTKRMICFLLIPRQRIRPKNCVRWATSLLILPAIISTPAVKINTNRTAAVANSVWAITLSAASATENVPCLARSLSNSILTPKSAMLNMAVTKKTEKMMQRRVIRLLRLCAFAEIGIRLR